MGTTLTPNLGLIKPDGSELASNFDTQNAANMDILDDQITDLKTDHGNNIQKRVGTNKTTSPSGSITTTETVVQSVTAPLIAGKKYRVRFYSRHTTNAAPSRFTARIREDNLAGSELTGSTFEITTTSAAATVEIIEAEFDAVSTGDKTFVATLIRGSGTGAVILGTNSYLYVDYVRD